MVPHHGPGFVMMKRGVEVVELLRRDPLAFALLALIAQRARWSPDAVDFDGLALGEALIGCEDLRMTRAQYRTRMARLQKWGFITIRTTNKGTIAKLVSPEVFDINAGGHDQRKRHQSSRHTAGKAPTNNHRSTIESPLTNKEKKETTKQGQIPVRTMWEAQQRISAIEEQITKISRDRSRKRYDAAQFKDVLNEDAREEIGVLRSERDQLKRDMAGLERKD